MVNFIVKVQREKFLQDKVVEISAANSTTSCKFVSFPVTIEVY